MHRVTITLLEILALALVYIAAVHMGGGNG